MKHLLILITLLAFYSCSKEKVAEPQPECVTITSIGTLYNDQWQVIDQWVILKLDKVCDPADINRFKKLIADQPNRGYQLCPPERIFETWSITLLY